MENINHTFLTMHQELYNEIVIPLHSKNAAVIVEPRIHPHLEFVFKNAAYFLPGWSFYVFHSKQNKSFISNVIGHNLNNVHLIEFCEDNISQNEYSRLLSTSEFYKNFKNVHYILIFQTDSYICRFGIEKYIEYDYDFIGAPWSHEPFLHQAGNGGLSLRKVDKMIEITETIPWHGQPEDLYFNSALQNNGKLANKYSTISQSFSVESIFHPNPLGKNQAWVYHSHFFRIHPEKIVMCKIIKASWGEGSNSIFVKELVQQMIDVEKIIYAKVAFLGDPSPFTKKYLTLFIYLNNEEKNFILQEDEMIDIYQIMG